MIASIGKYNFLTGIPGLRLASHCLTGRTCLLESVNGLSFFDPMRSIRHDGCCTFAGLGRQLLASGKFTSLSRIIFPGNPKMVREFVRLVVRTDTSLARAAEATGVKVEDLSRYHPRPVLYSIK
ncbi:MAG TPA: hypothetical protein VMD02_05755 [Candidatus Omnitrophota bacterium]|nr:hypothetical protein [Candidatus Omnitrophota bacterium]